MNIEEYLRLLPSKRKLSDVKLLILKRLWQAGETFPKGWVSSAELLDITQQKYFDRRTRELRDQLGCDLESSYREEFGGHGWRLKSSELSPPQDREYLTKKQKDKLFQDSNYKCSTCGVEVAAGVRGLQADHKVPLSRGGSNDLENWQSMCNNCNVGKRRACEGCSLDCNSCAWAFPDLCGVPLIISLSEATLQRVEAYSKHNEVSVDQIMENAANYYMDLER